MSSSGSTTSSSDEENVVGVDVASSETRKKPDPKTYLFKCPSTIMKNFAKGPFNRKKHLLQYVTPRQQSTKNAGGTRVWDCHVCLDEGQLYKSEVTLFRSFMPRSQSLS